MRTNKQTRTSLCALWTSLKSWPNTVRSLLWYELPTAYHCRHVLHKWVQVQFQWFSFGFAGQLLGARMATQWLLCVMNSFKLAQNRFWAWVHKIQLYGKFLLKKWMLSGNLNGKMHIKVYSSGNSDAEKTKADFATWYKKKKKSAYEKEDKKSHCRCARKTGPIRQAV